MTFLRNLIREVNKIKSLTKTERVVAVFGFIQEYLEKERFFNSLEILPFISSRVAKSSMDINLTGIKAAIRVLIDKNHIVEQSKITSKAVLSNKTVDIGHQKYYQHAIIIATSQFFYS